MFTGKFRADQDEEKETPEQLFDIIQYGLSKVISNDDSTIEDEDIDAILAKSEVRTGLHKLAVCSFNTLIVGEHEELVYQSGAQSTSFSVSSTNDASR